MTCGFCHPSSITKKQIVATTGLMLVLFLIGHLAGNLLIFLGPAKFNAYAAKLAGLRPGLYLVEVALAVVFLIHIFYTASIVLENIRARSQRYLIYKEKEKPSLAAKIMPFTGTLLLVFVIVHLFDFTFVDKEGPQSFINGVSYGLFGIVYNSFLDPLRSIFYVVAMGAVGFHLMHGIQSFAQTFGLNHPRYTPMIKNISSVLGFLVAFAFMSIPLCILYSN